MFTLVSLLRRSTLLFASLLFLVVCGFHANGQTGSYTVNETTLDSFDGTHPRVLLNNSTIGTIKNNIANPPSGTRWAAIWSSLKTNMDLQVSTLPTPYNASDVEQITERATSYGIREFSLMYLLTRTAQPTVDTKWLEAEDAVLVSPMVRQANAAADGGAVIGTPAGGSINNNTAIPSAVYNLSTLKSTAYYHVWARVYAPDANSNSFFYSLDDATSSNVVTNTYGSWAWVVCGSRQLTPGSHQLNITYQKTGLLIDSFVVTTDYNLVPSGLGTENHYLDAADFAINTAANIAVKTTDGLATDGVFLGVLTARTTAPAAGTVGDAQQTVSVNGGSYDVWVRFKAPAAASNAFYFALDGGAYSAVTLGTGNAYNDWVWQQVATGTSLVAGSHVLKVDSYKTGCEVDRFFVAPAGTTAPVDPNKYLTAARNWALTTINYPTWGQQQYANNDIAAASSLAGLGLYYDWCYADLSTPDRQQISSLIAARGNLFYHGYLGDDTADVPVAWWKNDFLDNLFWNYLTEFTIASMAIHGDSGMPDTLPWLQAALDGIGNHTLSYFGPDGADHEGPSYWGSIEFLLEYVDLAKNELGVDLTGTTWLQQTGIWRMYLNTATNYFNVSGPQINFADAITYEWDGPDYQLRKLASLYNLPTVQWLAGAIDDHTNNGFNLSPSNPGFQWLNLLWYNTSIPETSPATAGTPYFMHFADLDFTVSRSGWDGNESVVGFQCGPPIGHHVLSIDKPTYVDWGTNHVHPAANNFCFYLNGEWQIMNAGYTDKFTAFENSLLVNGAGQLGEGAFTFNGPAAKGEDAGGVLNPAIDTTMSFSTLPMDYLVGQASGAYPTAAGVNSYKRHLLYLKPDVLVAVDDVTLKAAKPLELRFYPWQRNGVLPNVTGSGNSYAVTGGLSRMSFNALSLPTQTALTYTTAVTTDNGASTTRGLFKLATGSSTPLASMSTAVSMASSPLAGTPRAVTFLADADGTAWKFKVGTSTMVLDRNTNTNYLDEKARLVTTVEAESVTPTSPMAVYTDETDASGGKYIAAATGTLINNPDTLTAPNAQYTLAVPAAGTYTIWARIKAADSNSASFFYALNPSGTGAYTSTCSTTTYSSWQWVKLTTTTFATATSTNVLALKYRQAGCKIDQFVLTGDTTYTPESKY